MFGSKRLVFASLLAVFDGAAAQDARACDDMFVEITNQTDIDFYKTCPDITGGMFFINHSFHGPFELPGVVSLSQMSSGYLGPKLKGSDRVDDGVTSVSMPDLKNITRGGMLFGYIDNLIKISFPKLESITGDIVAVDSYGLHNFSLPALSTVDGGIWLEGDFEQVVTTANISCPALGAAFASLTFKPKKFDPFSGFTCWTGYEDNSWNSSDPAHNPKPGGASAASIGSAMNARISASNAVLVSFVATFLFLMGTIHM